MGVVRRDGDWRLEKVEDGHYELTYQRELYAKIATPEFDPGLMGSVGFGLETVYEVDSYAEAEGIFEEHAAGSKPDIFSTGTAAVPSHGKSSGTRGSGFEFGSGDTGRTGDPIAELFEDANLPVGGLAVVLVLAGGITIWNYGIAPGDIVFQVAALFLGIGLFIFALALVVARLEGPDAAVEFLLTADGDSAGGVGTTEEDSPKTTTSVPSDRKRKLIFDRAGNCCEWCEETLDSPQIHHIKPRSEGGSHDPSNLIVLCPTCHSKADKGGISKNMLREKLRHIRSA